MNTYDPNHFCPSWLPCCEENLFLQPSSKKRKRDHYEESFNTLNPYRKWQADIIMYVDKVLRNRKKIQTEKDEINPSSSRL